MKRAPDFEIPCLTEAIRLARMGYHVGITEPWSTRPHPMMMAKAGDSPLASNSTTDLPLIDSWWRRCPEGNVFVALRDRVMVLEIVDYELVNQYLGDIDMDNFVKQFPAIQLPTGAWQFWMRAPESIRIAALPHILPFGRIESAGSHVVVPPSIVRSPAGDLHEFDSDAQLSRAFGKIPVVRVHDLRMVLAARELRPDEFPSDWHVLNLLKHGVSLARRGIPRADVVERLWEFNERLAPPLRGWAAERAIGDVADEIDFCFDSPRALDQ